MTRPSLSLPVLLALGLLAVPLVGRADDALPAPRTGGNFEIATIKDIAYYDGDDADPVKHRLDLYLPKGQKDFPVLFFVHGGTWRSGDKKLYGPLGQVFAKNGVGTVITNYRLSPKVKHPAHIEDVARAFAWTHAHIGRHGGRADRIFCCGHSAGGHLVALLATDETYLKAHRLSLSDIRGTIALSGVYTILPGLFSSQFGSDAEVCRKASPLNHVNGKHAPFLLIYADKDYPFCDRMAEQMCQALVRCNCEANTLKIKDRDHISIIVQVQKEDDPTTQAILDFIARHSELKLTPKGKSLGNDECRSTNDESRGVTSLPR
ncbi:MAG TPA: alpha/beta hydrolase [Gemmataceae bacterium]|nr:alpha/beta hydrolase [Gemmataceae bacterium]